MLVQGALQKQEQQEVKAAGSMGDLRNTGAMKKGGSFTCATSRRSLRPWINRCCSAAFCSAS